VLAGTSTSHAIISTNPATPGIFDGLNVSQLVGATQLYSLGYTGSRAIMANVEAGHLWGGASGHETLKHSFVQFNASPSASQPQVGEFDRHATWVGQIMGGRALPGDTGLNLNFRRGIAFGAQLWSGSIASTFGAGGSFSININTLTTGYIGPAMTGSAGKTADVINSSWGGNTPSGADFQGAFTDWVMNTTGKTFVASAGNSGPGGNSVGSPGLPTTTSPRRRWAPILTQSRTTQ